VLYVLDWVSNPVLYVLGWVFNPVLYVLGWVFNPVLYVLGWVCGKEALYMESLSEDQIAADIQGVLSKFLQKDIPLPSRVIRYVRNMV